MTKPFVQNLSLFYNYVMQLITIFTIFFSIILSTSITVLANNDVLKEHKSIHIMATTFPVYLFTKNIVSTRSYVNVDLLITSQSGCPHDYSPGPSDMARLANADIIIRYGMGLDANIDKVLKNVSPNAILIDASHGINSPGSTNSGSVIADPHIHASPEFAAMMVGNIAKALSSIDPEGADAYFLAAEKYSAKLLSSGRILNGCGRNFTRNGVILQQSSLTHLAVAAGFEIVAIIEEDEDKSPSPSKLMEIAKVAKDGRSVLIICETKLSDKLARSIAEESGLPIVRLDSLSSGPANAPDSFYETIMAQNCKLLGQHFGLK